MNKKFLNTIILIIIFVIVLYFVRNKYQEFNINKAVSACVLAQVQISENFDKNVAKKKCEEEIQKSIKK